MTVPRVILGKYNDGVTIGMRSSLQGFNALTESPDSGGMSFDSTWTDIASALQVGIVSAPSSGFTITVNFTSPGYVPFCEVRMVQGDTVFDDGVFGSGTSAVFGVGAVIGTSTITIPNRTLGVAYIYTILNIPVQSG
jgi:hypothetical protein